MRALVIEGGGMKAAYANGVLTAFERAGAGGWDVVAGTSAGGALAAWYSAGQAEFAEGTWAYAAHRDVLSYRRLLHPTRPVLDHEHLLEWVYKDDHPLDVDAVRLAQWQVVVTAADVDTGEVLYPDIRDRDVLGWLKATGRLPFGSGPPVELEGRRLLDGGVVDPLPIRHVVETLGASEVVMISNNVGPRRRPDPKPLVALAARRYPAFADQLRRHEQIKAESYAFALHPPEGVDIRVIRPSRPLGVHRMTRDQNRLAAAVSAGRRDGERFLAA